MQSKTFGNLLSSILKRRWYITFLVLATFILLIAGIFAAIEMESAISGEWKELLLLMLGAFIGSYNKMVEYWFSNRETDQLLVQKADEEDGESKSKISDIIPVTPMPHRDCTHNWVNTNNGELECSECGLTKTWFKDESE